MAEQARAYLRQVEDKVEENEWVAPLAPDDRDFLAYFRAVCRRYNIEPSRATRLEYEFVTRVAEREFYIQQVNA